MNNKRYGAGEKARVIDVNKGLYTHVSQKNYVNGCIISDNVRILFRHSYVCVINQRLITTSVHRAIFVLILRLPE
jgi:hypothetical protein